MASLAALQVFSYTTFIIKILLKIQLSRKQVSYSSDPKLEVPDVWKEGSRDRLGSNSLPLINHVTLDLRVSFLVTWFSHLSNGDDNSSLPRRVG